MDQFAFHDIPDSIDYILQTTSRPSLSYIGFSQGTAQAFATLSIHPTLNDKVDVFIALAPAMSPAGLHNGVVDALMKASPEVIFLAFGRKSILSSATMWQNILYPPIFVRIIDMSLSFLFNWSGRNISTHQKLAAYPHLYSFTSTKSVVHWFQIIRNKSFQMYDDEVQAPLSVGASDRYYKVAKFPTRNIKTPIVLVYGGSDSLVDINVMLKELPRHTIAKEVAHFEHLDFLWAQEVDKLVFPHVFEALGDYAGKDHTKSGPFTYRPNRNGVFATHPRPNGSETASDADTDISRATAKSYAAAARERPVPGRLEARDDNPSPQDSNSLTVSPVRARGSVNMDDSADSPSSTAESSNSASKHRRSDSPSSLSSTGQSRGGGSRKFSQGGISVGAGKATVGRVVSDRLTADGQRMGFQR